MTCSVCGKPALIVIHDEAEIYVYSCSLVHLVAKYREAWEELFA